MSRSSDAGHFFQTTASLSEIERRAAKSKNTAGDPIKFSSKILALLADPEDADVGFVAEAAAVVRRVRLESKNTSVAFTGPTAPVTCLALSSSNAKDQPRTLFAGSWDKSIYAYSVPSSSPSSSQPIRKYVAGGHTDFVKAIVYVQIPLPVEKGRATERRGYKELLVSGGQDAKIIIWDVQTGKALKTLKGHARGVQCLAIDPLSLPGADFQADNSTTSNGAADTSGIILFSADTTREIRRWRIRLTSTGDIDAAQIDLDDKPEDFVGPIDPIVAHETSIYTLHFDADGDLWTASADKSVKCLSRERKWTTEMELPHPDFVRDVVVDEAGGWVVTVCRDEEVRVWERGEGRLRCVYSGHWEEVTSVAIVGTGGRRRVVSGSIDGTVRSWSLAPDEMGKVMEERERVERGELKEEEETETETALPGKAGERLMTEEEERELAELMDEDD
ncbi:WD40 repeat-like protein [Aulographum hederae CBS 113979]|uniref:WD40 repeat-like protein n=1 Tax=Aulographum hederae CBS 113979 TaxID=1176131 RepID=A0A6G1HBH2_9PEZI|nr:WD40 repeat-like protein [Aulographum hederae CBS 113979]